MSNEPAMSSYRPREGVERTGAELGRRSTQMFKVSILNLPLCSRGL